MKIEKLTRSTKNPDRYYAEFENGERLRVSVALIADYSLYTGREFDEDEFEALKRATEGATAKARALRILGKRNMSLKEMTNRLVEKGESEETAQETGEWLVKIGAVNDTDYAAMIVRHYFSKGYGSMRIRDELYRRGIEKELWEDAMNEMPDTEDGALGYLSAKLKGEKPDKAALKRATDALYRRGFSWDEIKTATARYLSETEELMDHE